jgi:hypothetical protein
MNKLINGLTVGSASLAMGGLTAILLPNQAGVVALVGSLGSGGAAIVMQQRKDKVLKDQEQRLLGALQQEVYRAVQPIEYRLGLLDRKVQQVQTVEVVVPEKASEVVVAEPEIVIDEPTIAELEVTGDGLKVSEEVQGTSAELAPSVALAAEAIAWLGTRNIQVERFYQGPTDEDVVFDRIALSLGQQFERLGALYRIIKRSASQGGNVSFSVEGKSQQERGAMTNFCTLLQRYGMLSFYRYDRPKQALMLEVQPRSDIRKFFTGIWLERYVHQVIVKVLRQKGSDYSVLMNPQVLLPNGDRFEFDLLFLVEGQPLWLECKTGRGINKDLVKYSKHRQTLGVPKERSLLVMLGYSAAQSEELERLWEMTAASERSVEALVIRALG